MAGFFFKAGTGRGTKRALISGGLTLIVFGTLIILFPRVFSYFVAGLLILAGLGSLIGGFSLRKRQQPPRSRYTTEEGQWEEIE